MIILHTIAGLSAKSGGTSTCTYDLLDELNRQNYFTELLTLDVKDPRIDTVMGKGESWIHALPNDSITPYGYSKNIKNFLKEETKYDLYHSNGLWMYCNHITCKIARKKQKPYIITPHGMLYSQALKRNSWKKKPLIYLYFREDLNYADCIHCTCEDEMKNCRSFGLKNPIAVIPNLINIPDFVNSCNNNEHKKSIGFLGRLHPIKKIENLLYAWSIINEKIENETLIIMGSGDSAYEKFLKSEVHRLKLKNVSFIGFVTGKEKFKNLASLSALCVPSDFENFGMIIPESLSVGTPVIASLGTPWKTLNDKGCGWWVDNSPAILAETIETALNLSKEELTCMGNIGKQFVKDEFSGSIVANKMKRLYEWIINKGEKPEFVYL